MSWHSVASAQAAGAGEGKRELTPFEEKVRAVLLAHPEILTEMLEELRARETAARIAPLREELEKPYHGAWFGAVNGDVTVVEFLDYACPHCRAMASRVEQLVKEDPGVKVVVRALPILGPESDVAAVQSLAAAEAMRFADYHRTIWQTDDALGPEVLARAAKAADLETPVANAAARRAEIDKNMELARSLRVAGTPTFIIGDTVLSGEPSLVDLQRAVAAARARSGLVPD